MARYTEADRLLVHELRDRGVTFNQITKETGFPFGSVVNLARRTTPYATTAPSDPPPAAEAARPEEEDLRAAATGAQRQIAQLQEQLEHIQTTAKDQAVMDFFKGFNTTQNSKLLDQFHKANSMVPKRITPENIEFLWGVLKMFAKFLEKTGIKPIHQIGERLEITLDESHEYDYVGSNWIEELDKKRVEVITPGWTYKDAIVSRPMVKEIE